MARRRHAFIARNRSLTLAMLAALAAPASAEETRSAAVFATETHTATALQAVADSPFASFITQTLGVKPGELLRWVNDPDCFADNCDGSRESDIENELPVPLLGRILGRCSPPLALFGDQARRNACWACRNPDHFNQNGAMWKPALPPLPHPDQSLPGVQYPTGSFASNYQAEAYYIEAARQKVDRWQQTGSRDRGREAVRMALRACHYASDRQACGHKYGNKWCDPDAPGRPSDNCRYFVDRNRDLLGAKCDFPVVTTVIDFCSTCGDVLNTPQAGNWPVSEAVAYAAAERIIRHYSNGQDVWEAPPITGERFNNNCTRGCEDGECLNWFCQNDAECDPGSCRGNLPFNRVCSYPGFPDGNFTHHPTAQQVADVTGPRCKAILLEALDGFPAACPNPRRNSAGRGGGEPLDGPAKSMSQTFADAAAAAGECCGAGCPHRVELVYLRPADRAFRRVALGELEAVAAQTQAWFKQQLDGSSFTWGVRTEISGHPASWFAGNDAGGERADWFWKNARAEGLSLVGAPADDPYTIWVFYVDAEPECAQSQRLGRRVSVFGRPELDGLNNGDVPDSCGGRDRGWRCGRAKNLAGSILGALGLDPPAGDYPNEATLPEVVKTALLGLPFFKPEYGAEITSQHPNGFHFSCLFVGTSQPRSGVRLTHATTGSIELSFGPGERAIAAAAIPGVGTRAFSDGFEPAELPKSFDGLEVLVEGQRSPLLFVSPSQVDFALPYEAPLHTSVPYGAELELRLRNRRLTDPVPTGTRPEGIKGLFHTDAGGAVGWACGCNSCGPLPDQPIASYGLFYGSGFNAAALASTSIIVDHRLASFPGTSPSDPLIGSEYPNRPQCFGRPRAACSNDFEATGYGVDLLRWTPPPVILKELSDGRSHGVAMAYGDRHFRGNSVGVKFEWCGAVCPVNPNKLGACNVNCNAGTRRDPSCLQFCPTEWCDCDVTNECRERHP